MATILVVDDELGIRDLLSEILNDEGHTVELAENAAQARAVRAVLRLRERGSDIRLVMIGQETEEFRQFYNELPDSEKRFVHMLGFVEESLKHAYLRDAKALLLPSRTDSFGIVLLESWLYSRPVVAAAAGGIPGVVDNGNTGILVPFGDIPYCHFYRPEEPHHPYRMAGYYPAEIQRAGLARR